MACGWGLGDSSAGCWRFMAPLGVITYAHKVPMVGRLCLPRSRNPLPWGRFRVGWWTWYRVRFISEGETPPALAA